MGPPQQPRVTCYQRAWLKLLAENRAISVHAVQLSGRRMRIVLDEPIALNGAVSVEIGDWLALGEVGLCRGEYAHYVAELELEQMLIGLQEIDSLGKRWGSRVAQPPSFVVHVPKQPVA